MILSSLEILNRRNLTLAALLTWVVTQVGLCMPRAFAEDKIFAAPRDGAVFMEETTSQKDPKLTWKVLRSAYERVRQGRLDEADPWLMYAMQYASSDPLLGASEDCGYLANGLGSAQNCDVRVLQALIQTRLGSPRLAIESLRFVERNCPTYHSMNQVKSRIRTLDLIINPPPQPSYQREPRELSPKEFQEILNRIAREKLAIAENQKTLDQALAEAREEQLEQFSRWRADRFPLKVFIPPDASCSKIPGYIAGDRNILIAAFQLWKKTMKDRIKFAFVDSPMKADIACEWVDHPNKLGSKAKDAVGTCSTSCTDSFSIITARIKILTVNAKGAAPNGAGFRGKFLRNVALHEIGHALGLAHLPNEETIMYFQLHDPLLDTFATDDVSAMEKAVLTTQKEAMQNAKTARAQGKASAASANIDAASERLQADEDTIRDLVTEVDSTIKGAKDLERYTQWSQAFYLYNDAFKYRPHDESIRQSICRTANNAGRVALKKQQKNEALEVLSRGRELMNKSTPLELRRQILENLRQAYEASNQPTEAAEVQTLLDSGNF